MSPDDLKFFVIKIFIRLVGFGNFTVFYIKKPKTFLFNIFNEHEKILIDQEKKEKDKFSINF